nr:immunoglobulin light chain junction region [Macaca mulatta]MOW09950.1 immunoglobulin light chain junction region [Macaca mulatta]MOW10216.1 immunoglobulin light chain junction region [Macaca mulatta]MOW10567.1 immunoglobulin light chain junction region [Macaca mulatta]MOW13317.1 immunoglobulin light chain junction region [Macaca mulatta]
CQHSYGSPPWTF